MHSVSRSWLLCALLTLLLAPSLVSQVVQTELPSLTQLASTTPLPGATNVPLNQTLGITATGPLLAHSINEDSVQVTVGGTALIASYTLSVDARTILIGFPTLLPPNARIDVTMDCSAIRDRAGRRVDFDLDGREGGIATGHFLTGDGGNTPPIRQGTAAVFARVFDVGGAPMPGAVMRGWFFPRLEGQPPLPVPFGISNAAGEIRWDTPVFAGEQSFLVEVSKPGFSEVLRRVTVLVDGCVRIDDAVLQQMAPRTVVDRLSGGTVSDPTGLVSIVIPPGALQATSNIGITVLQNSNAVRERLPNNVVGGAAGLYVDVAGVFGEQTTQPVTMRVPNTYNLPIGTQIPFGKVDHNTLEWVDFRNLYSGPPPQQGQPHPALGRVVSNGAGGTVIEVQFDHFCTPVCSYCLPIRPPEEPTTPDGDAPPTDDGEVCGSSTIDSREGFLRETIALPGFTEFGNRWNIHLGYASSCAAPTATMRAQSRYSSPNGRPVERTLFRYSVEGRTFEAAYDRSTQNQRPLSHCFWDGRNVLGQWMPTGSYPYTMEITTLNADVPVAIPSTFGGTSIQSFGSTYPGQIRTQSTVKRDRLVVVNLRESPYGAGWSVMEEDRLHIDGDGCLVLVYGNGWHRRYAPNLASPGTWISRSGDFSTITYDTQSQTYRRSFTDGEVHTFARSGLLQRRVDRFGYATTFSYNANGRLTQITSPRGFFYRFFYDAANKLDRIEDSAARVTQVTVNGNGDLTEVIDVLNARRQFTYDPEHRMLTNVGVRGERAEYAYQNGRIVRTRQFDVGGGALLRERLFSPSSLSGEVVEALASGLGSLGQPLPIVQEEVDVYTDGVGGTHRFYRDAEGQIVRQEDPINRQVDHTYFPNGQRQSTGRPDGSSIQYTYDNTGLPLTIVERNAGGGNYSTVTHEYEPAFRQLSRIVDGEGKQTLLTYNSFGSIVTVTDHDSRTTTLTYGDPRFPTLATRIVSPAGVVQTASYDTNGNMVAWTDFPDPTGQPQGRTWTLTRDARGNVTQITLPGGQSTAIQYDSLDRPIRITEPLNRITQLRYDDPACGCSSSSNLTGVTLPNSATLTFVYDGLGRRVRELDQFLRATIYAHDAEDRLLSVTNRLQQRIAYEYDLAGQLIRKVMPDASVTTYAYDVLGNMTRAADPVCAVDMTWDFLSRMTSSTTIVDVVLPGGQRSPRTYQIYYQYNRVGNRTRMYDNQGTYDVSYGYNNLHALASLTVSTPQSRSWTFTYDFDGRRTRIQRSGGVATDYTYDLAGQLTSIVHQTNPQVQQRFLTRDPNGNVLTMEQRFGGSLLTKTYGYDAAGRLVTANQTAQFGDLRANQTTTYDLANRAVTGNEFTYAHDDEGRLTRRTWVGQSTYEEYQWDAEDRLLAVRQFYSGGPTPVEVMAATYGYDPLGRRLESNVNGVIKRHAYDMDDQLHMFDDAGRILVSHVGGLDLDDLMGTWDRRTTTWTHMYTGYDRSLLAVSDTAGVVAADLHYDEYGTWIGGAGPAAFLGRQADLETGLHQLRARYYSSVAGRFLNEDPIGIAGGYNLYDYARGNPIRYQDRAGLSPLSWSGFTGCFMDRWNATHDFLGLPYVKAGANIAFGTQAVVAQSFGTVSPIQAIKSILWPGLGPRGIAALGGVGPTLGSAALNAGLAIVLSTLAFEGGIAIGSALGSLADNLNGESCQCRR